MGTVYPTLKTLAENVKMTEKTVRETLKRLQQKGVLDIKRQGLNRPNIYTIRDSADIWNAGSNKEQYLNQDYLDIQQKIAELESLGYKVTKKKKTNSFNQHMQHEKKNESELEFLVDNL